jgi:Tetratricopeptide repeat
MMKKYRFLFSALAISIGVLVIESFSNFNGAFAQTVEDAAQLDQQARQLRKQGRYAEAEPLFKRSLAMLEKARGPDHPDVATGK